MKMRELSQPSTTWLRGDLEGLFSNLVPLSPIPSIELFVSTTFGWTAFFQNGCWGSDPFLPMFQLSKELGVMALRACVSPFDSLHRSVILEVYNTPQQGGNKYGYRRSITAAKDGETWIFEQSGAPFHFEDTQNYEKRIKRERFTPKMLSFYLKSLGIPPLDDEVFQHKNYCRGFLLAKASHDHAPKYSLEVAKAL